MAGQVEGCPVNVPDGGRLATSHRCGRAVKDEGLCGLHLSAKRRDEEKVAQRNLLRKEAESQVALARGLASRLAEAFGFDVAAQTSFPTVGPRSHMLWPTGKALIDLGDLEDLMQKMQEGGN